MFTILLQYHSAFFAGLCETLTIAGIAWCVGITLGFTLSYHISMYLPRLATSIGALSFVLSNIPIIIILMWCYYPLQMALGINVSGTITTIIVLSLLNSIGISQIALEAMQRFPVELGYAADSLGIGKREFFLWIKMPIILKEIIPTVINLQISILHMTLFGSLLSANELFRTSQRIISQTYTPIAVYSALALFFLMVGLGMQFLIAIWKRRTRFFEGKPL